MKPDFSDFFFGMGPDGEAPALGAGETRFDTAHPDDSVARQEGQTEDREVA